MKPRSERGERAGGSYQQARRRARARARAMRHRLASSSRAPASTPPGGMGPAERRGASGGPGRSCTGEQPRTHGPRATRRRSQQEGGERGAQGPRRPGPAVLVCRSDGEGGGLEWNARAEEATRAAAAFVRPGPPGRWARRGLSPCAPGGRAGGRRGSGAPLRPPLLLLLQWLQLPLLKGGPSAAQLRSEDPSTDLAATEASTRLAHALPASAWPVGVGSDVCAIPTCRAPSAAAPGSPRPSPSPRQASPGQAGGG